MGNRSAAAKATAPPKLLPKRMTLPESKPKDL
eukprot:CAMPEP_0171482068 /NCGR_PEP_ID=MMETSP0946-20130122/7207_1 /TAXON_ID=109269 /ORGANISM="Vaucheria litorea, Strain CCMP2940" /LENGTH=31 /DNA_ID= /DNA_START= /DNA_END= /DNA_ORIENTATION=